MHYCEILYEVGDDIEYDMTRNTNFLRRTLTRCRDGLPEHFINWVIGNEYFLGLMSIERV